MFMNIHIFQLLEGAKAATGLTIIIDVFRAFSTACYATDLGAAKIIPVGNIDEAYNLQKKYPGSLLMGERHEKKPEGFDFGNSPSQLKRKAISGKTIIHTTSSGTQGIVNAKNADEIITGSFVNSGAIVQYIRQRKPDNVSLVCMGYACKYPTDEDTLCAVYLKNELEGKPSNLAQMKAQIRKGSGARFFAPEKQEWAPQADFDMCLALNRFNFVLKAEEEEGKKLLRKIDIHTYEAL